MGKYAFDDHTDYGLRLAIANELAEANRLKRLEMSKLYQDLPRESEELEDKA